MVGSKSPSLVGGGTKAPKDLCVTASGVSRFDEDKYTVDVTASEQIYDTMVRGQVKKVVGRYVQSVFLDHFYRKSIKKVVRMMLFQVI